MDMRGIAKLAGVSSATVSRVINGSATAPYLAVAATIPTISRTPQLAARNAREVTAVGKVCRA